VMKPTASISFEGISNNSAATKGALIIHKYLQETRNLLDRYRSCQYRCDSTSFYIMPRETGATVGVDWA
jgi:hypothetical protein